MKYVNHEGERTERDDLLQREQRLYDDVEREQWDLLSEDPEGSVEVDDDLEEAETRRAADESPRRE